MGLILVQKEEIKKINRGTDIFQFPNIRLKAHEPYKMALVYFYPNLYLSVSLPLNSTIFCIDNFQLLVQVFRFIVITIILLVFVIVSLSCLRLHLRYSLIYLLLFINEYLFNIFLIRLYEDIYLPILSNIKW